MNIAHEDEVEEHRKLKKTQSYIDNEIAESEERIGRGFEDYDFDDYTDDFMKAALKERFSQRIKNLKMVKRQTIFCKSGFCGERCDKERCILSAEKLW